MLNLLICYRKITFMSVIHTEITFNIAQLAFNIVKLISNITQLIFNIVQLIFNIAQLSFNSIDFTFDIIVVIHEFTNLTFFSLKSRNDWLNYYFVFLME